jgi:hypothetical protein
MYLRVILCSLVWLSTGGDLMLLYMGLQMPY